MDSLSGRVKLVILVAVVAVALAAGVTCRLTGGGEDDEPEYSVDASGPGETDLVHRYAPLYNLRLQEHECDRRGEPFVPSQVEIVLGQPGVNLRQPGQPPITAPTAGDLPGAAERSYLDYPGDPRDPGCSYEREARRLGATLSPTVYAHVVSVPEESAVVIQYWAYYYFNDWNNKHEGDWEMVQVIFDASSLDDAMKNGPSYVVYAQHGGGERADWNDKKLRKVGDRPVVFVSAGSHASYFAPATYLGLGEPGTGFGCDVALGPHWQLDPQVVQVREPAPGADGGEEWLAFRGRWGQVLSGEFNGPTGPQTKRSWQEPVTWAEGARSGSATLPGGDFLGVDSVHSFCDAVETGSRLLRAYMRFPLLVGGSVFLVLGVMSAGGLVLLKDALRSPLVDKRTAGFLRKRRSLGQIIRATTVIYWRYPRLFLGIAFAFVPVGFVLAALQGLIFKLPLVDRLHWLLGANQVSHLFVGLLVGGVASFAVYLFAVSGATAAVRFLDEGGEPTVQMAYRRALERAPHILLGRGRTLLAIALLGATIVGLPFAAWLAVRWFFVEEAVVLDDESHWGAPGASSRAAGGQWWRALGRVLLFGVLGALAGPILAFVALVGTDANPALVNILAGLFHAAALPFTAIGLSLSYCDLRERAAERPPSPPGTPQRFGGARAAAAWVLHRLEGRRRGG